MIDITTKVDYEIKPVDPQHLMPGLITEGCEWAYPKEKSFKKNLRFIRNNKETIREDTENLALYLTNKFDLIKIKNRYKEVNEQVFISIKTISKEQEAWKEQIELMSEL